MNSNALDFLGTISLYGLFVIVVLVVVVVVQIIKYQNRKKHRAAMWAFAALNGWQFYDEFDFPFLRELAQYTGKIEKGLFGEAIPNPLTVRSKNVIQGIMHGRNFAVFEQTY